MIMPEAMDAIFALLCASLVLTLWIRENKSFHRHPLPPGPKKLPIVGNLFDIPIKGKVWLEYAKLCRKFNSDIIHLSVLGKSIVALNSAKIINDLLDKRSSLYFGRPDSVMVGELMRWENMLFYRPCDNEWKAQRKILNQAIPPNDVARFHPKLLQVTHDLVRDLFRTDDVRENIQDWAGIFITDVALNSLGSAAIPGAFYVDFIPFLKYVPEWFPGANFKRTAREWNGLHLKMIEDPFSVAKERIMSGTATPSLVSAALYNMDLTQDPAEQEERIKAVSAMALLASSDTTVHSLETIILALLMNPDVQKKAQSELDKVLGPGDLPSFNDEQFLPYITAIIWEAMRFQPVAPIGVPHVLTKDDIYNGYLLPKGSFILANVWSICHNEAEFPDPMRFDPMRYLNADGKINSDVRDSSSALFGFGRRVCPGRHIAIASLWIAVASILACYTIEPELDKKGKPIDPKGEWDSASTLFNAPLPFKCRFVPRSKDMEAFSGLNVD